MFQLTPGPGLIPGEILTAQHSLSAVGSSQYAISLNGAGYAVRMGPIQKSIFVAALGSGAGTTLWPAPGAGKRIVLQGICVSVSAAGRLQIQYVTGVVMNILLPASTPMVVIFGPLGLDPNIVNQAFNLVNQNAAAVDVAAFAWGDELT